MTDEDQVQTQIQSLKNDLLLLRRQFEAGIYLPQVQEAFKTLQEFQDECKRDKDAYKASFDAVENMRNRINSVEKFIRHLMDFFDPEPKAKKQIDRLNKELKEKEQELQAIKDKLAGMFN